MTISNDAVTDLSLLTFELKDVVREYRLGRTTVRALDKISAQFSGGQFVAIVGPSGSGKSTLLHLLGALDSPSSGSIIVDGVDIGQLGDNKQSEYRRRNVGFVFQFFNLLPTLSAWENVAVPSLLDGSPIRRGRPRAHELLELVGLGHRAEHRPAELSGGETQRVAVARALMMDPRIILADEPTGNLDSKNGAAILELLDVIAHESTLRAVIMCTHDAEGTQRTDRVISLQDGRIRSDEAAPSRVTEQ